MPLSDLVTVQEVRLLGPPRPRLVSTKTAPQSAVFARPRDQKDRRLVWVGGFGLWGAGEGEGAYTGKVVARLTLVPRDAVILPLPVVAPKNFVPERAETWPDLPGRYEFVDGRLEYMPPCGEIQQLTAVDVSFELSVWRRKTPGFTVGANEAGMYLGGDVRAADAAVWPAKKPTHGFARTAPILAVEVAGEEDTAPYLEKKADWYLAHGVECVWLVFPETRSVTVVTKAGRVEVGVSGRIPEHPSLPGLTPAVEAFFQQL